MGGNRKVGFTWYLSGCGGSCAGDVAILAKMTLKQRSRVFRVVCRKKEREGEL